MKQKPPYYSLDTETRRLCEMVTYWARQLESVQQPPFNTDMMSVIHQVEERLGLLPPTDEDDDFEGVYVVDDDTADLLATAIGILQMMSQVQLGEDHRENLLIIADELRARFAI